MDISNSFNAISNTGEKVLILKAMGECDCVVKDSLVDSEPNPKCPKCLGTGKIRGLFLSEKIRVQNQSKTASENEDKDGYSFSLDSELFFFKNYYDFINNDDLICTLDFKSKKPDKIFSVASKQNFIYNQFYFLEIVGKKIHFSINLNEVLEEVGKWIS